MKLKQKLDKLFKSIESRLTVGHKVTVGAAFSALTLILLLSVFADKQGDPFANSVAITDVRNEHGGTGIILSSSDTESLVLTNRHVCELTKSGGGVVHGIAGDFNATMIKESEAHDLCLLKVIGNLKSSTKIANRPPKQFYEKAVIAGHPNLLPTVLTNGHFSGRRTISVVTGFRECTEADLQSPLAPLCLILGKMPIVKQYDSVLVTATIMPGSSGSAVYNSDGELTGVVFAGSGSLGYAWTVPYNHLKFFLEVEQNTLMYQKVGVSVSNGQSEEKKEANETRTLIKKMSLICSNADADTSGELKAACKEVMEDLVWSK